LAPYPCRKTTSCSGAGDYAATRGPSSVTAILLWSVGSGFGFVEESRFRAKVKAVEHRQALADFVCKAWVGGAFPARFAIERNHPIEQESLKINELEQVLRGKVCHLF